MKKIPVTRNFDNTDPIGFLTLQDDVDIFIDNVFALGYTILETVDGKPTKIHVHEVSLIPDSHYQPYVEVELREARAQIREWQQDYEQLVQVAEMYVNAFGEDEMLTLLEAMRLTAVRDAIARWRKKQEPVNSEKAL